MDNAKVRLVYADGTTTTGATRTASRTYSGLNPQAAEAHIQDMVVALNAITQSPALKTYKIVETEIPEKIEA
ncbi:DUF1659 domain-containing protein [Peptoniphilus equinus]|uniref:DUF1659 domain-containing protein n=1 Tax=Peptoniphilus equinus TaxID=3016343 RepID=A0ABY7QSP1_9FIRM|nr:DUF1659 domain-containing protein [Peptoniphilus equinus]WBW49752.1 DUF1659 domain-containing protein [Peptoniphilus equinus]